MRTIVTTVGTSLLTNRDGRPWEGWRREQPLPDETIVDQWLQSANPVAASAETHTWHRLGLFEADGRGQVKVVLVHSHTPEGEFCGRRLASLAIRGGVQSKIQRVDGLCYTDNKTTGTTFNRALGRLARIIADKIRG